MKSRDYFNGIMRFSKTFVVNKFRIQFIMDINNLFNTLRLWGTGDQAYRVSLHLPESDDYDNIPGDDKVGDYRTPGVDFQPMEQRQVINTASDVGREGVIYYEGSSETYLEYVEGEWSEVEAGRLDQILEDKAYIDMPNLSTFWFLNPRQIYFGLRLTFDLQ